MELTEEDVIGAFFEGVNEEVGTRGTHGWVLGSFVACLGCVRFDD